MTDQPNFVNREKHREAGFSLVELLIATIVFLVFLSAVYGLLRITNIQRTTVSSQTEVMTNLRLSLNILGRDAVNAGLGYSRVGGNMPDNLTNSLMGLPADVDLAQDFLTAVVAGNNVNANDFLPVTERTDVVAFAYRLIREPTPNQNDEPITITGAGAIGTGGVILTTAPGAALVANDNATPFDLYLISNGTRTAVALATGRPDASTLRFETGSVADLIGINAPYTGSVDGKSKLVNCADLAVGATDCMNYPATAKKVFWVSYQITQDGTLTRTTYGNNTGGTAAQQIQIQPLAYNIQNMQIRYLLRDGTSSENPSNNGANQNILNNVVQVEVTISARINVQEQGVNLQRVVDLKSTFSTKNLNYD